VVGASPIWAISRAVVAEYALGVPEISVHSTAEANIMFLTIGVILVLLWALGAFVVPIGGGLIHILLVLALISIVWHLMNGRRVV
jgi:hypothetical protein